MRNLLEYPIKPQEVVECLLLLKLKLEIESEARCEPSFGNMVPLLLKTAAAVVTAADNVLAGVDERLRKEGDALKYVSPWKELTALIDAFNIENPGYKRDG